MRGPSGAAKSPHAAPPPAPPGPLCPPATRRAHPGRLGSSLGAGATPAHGWAQGSGCPVPTASASPVPGTRVRADRHLVISDAATFYFKLNGTCYGWIPARFDRCVRVKRKHSPLARILGLLAGLKQILWKMRRGTSGPLLSLHWLISASRSKQPPSRRIVCCPSSPSDMLRSSFSHRTPSPPSCLLPPLGSVRDRKLCRKLLCGDTERYFLPESLHLFLVPWRPINKHSAPLFSNFNSSFLQHLPKTPPVPSPGTSRKVKEAKTVLKF